MKLNIQNPAFLQMAGRSGKGISLFYVTSHVDDNEITFADTRLGTFADNVEYSTDNAETWNQLTVDTIITLGDAETVYFRNYTKEVYSAEIRKKVLKTSDLYSVGGDITALFYPGVDLPDNAFQEAFNSDTNLTSASALILPSANLSAGCFINMFAGSGLTEAPTLPATTLARDCYNSMFAGCTGLTKAPNLPATTLDRYCYDSMFLRCTALTEAPSLPATTLAVGCYASMFSGCTGLTEAPSLPATTLADECYNNMFSKCTGLTKAPTLPATTLAQYCYGSMFSNCTGLNKIICKATDISAEGCTESWVNGVSATGTFEKPAEMNDWTTGTSGIPDNWTVISPH